MMLGTLESESIQAAQQKLLNLLREHGVADEHISYNVTNHHTITIGGDFTLSIHRPLRFIEWGSLIIPLLNPANR